VDPFDSKLTDAKERGRLTRLFTQGLEKVAGYALPLKWHEKKWLSSSWLFRAERMYLIPGDSPMGLRLPLDSLLWLSPEEQPVEAALDPLSKLESARLKQPHIMCAIPDEHSPEPFQQQPISDQGKMVRTALCVEVRHGCLYIFMPPLDTSQPYFDLISAIEATAESLRIPVVIEGYPPPADPLLRSFQITPDPGVLEVNIHPAKNWQELRENTLILYEEARLARLGSEKFMLDGRHTGTGGGNHIIIGGATPSDSPILRRPSLLTSLLGYWNNHPSLSYLFSGLFIGPTSQAPRVDEGRRDSLYELELGFQ
jgi:uncharacterized protein (DUF2126 family)